MSSSAAARTPNEAIRVYVRVRPPNSNEQHAAAHGEHHCSLNHVTLSGAGDGLHSPTGQLNTTVTAGSTTGGNERTFNLDGAFPCDSSQKTVYDSAALPIVEAVLEGFNGTVLAYGQTGTGKTHTIEGMRMSAGKRRRMRSMDTTTALTTPGTAQQLFQEETNHGVIPRMVHTVFSHIAAAESDVEFQIKLSICEIYMERIRDLLVAPPKHSKGKSKTAAAINPHNLRIRENPKGDIYIEGLSDWYVSSPEEIFEAFGVAQNNRAVSETNMNAHSSRSHLIFILSVVQAAQSGIKVGKLCLVDLAGSEKVSKSGADGVTLEEAKQINKSLSALGNVINALTTASKGRQAAHVPYRSSKLTRALQESLGGNSKTCLICTVSPSELHDAETLSTLRFGQRAKLITNAAHVNQELTVDELKKIVTASEAKLLLQAYYISVLRRHISTAGTSPVPPIPVQLRADDSLPPHSIAAYDDSTSPPAHSADGSAATAGGVEADKENIPPVGDTAADSTTSGTTTTASPGALQYAAPAAPADECPPQVSGHRRLVEEGLSTADDDDEVCSFLEDDDDDDEDEDDEDDDATDPNYTEAKLHLGPGVHTPNSDGTGLTTAAQSEYLLTTPTTADSLSDSFRQRTAELVVVHRVAGDVALRRSASAPPNIILPAALLRTDEDFTMPLVRPASPQPVLTSVPTTPVYVQGAVSTSLGDSFETTTPPDDVSSLMGDPESVRCVIEKTQKLATHLDQLTVMYHKALNKNADLQGQSTVQGRELKRLDETVTDLKRELQESRDQYSRLLQRCSQLTVAMEGISLPKVATTGHRTSAVGGGSSAASTSSGTSSHKIRPNPTSSGSWYRGANHSNFSFAGINVAKRWLNITKPLRGGGGGSSKQK